MKEKWIKGNDFLDNSTRYSLEGRDIQNSCEDIKVVIITERKRSRDGGYKNFYYGTVIHEPTETEDTIEFKSVKEAKEETYKLFEEYRKIFNKC